METKEKNAPDVKIRKSVTKMLVTNHYRNDGDLGDKTVTLTLEIDYLNKTFNIIPFANGKNEFKFLNLSSSNGCAKAVAECISKAIDFAGEQLRLHEFSESNAQSN